MRKIKNTFVAEKIHLFKTPKNQSGYFRKGSKFNSGQNSVCHHAKICVDTLKEFNVKFFFSAI